MPYVLFVLMCMIWGTSFLLMRWASGVFNAPAINTGRMLGGSAVLFLIWFVLRAHAKGAKRWTLSRGDLPALAIVVIVGFVLPWTLQPFLIGRYQQSGFFGMMVSLVPLLTMVVSVPMLGLKPTLRQSAGVLLGLVMVVVLFGDAVSTRGVPAWAMALAVVVPCCYAVSNTWVKQRFQGADMLALSASAMALGLVFVLPFARVNEVPANDVPMGKAVASLAFLGVVCSGLAMWMFYKMVQLKGPLFAGMVTYVVPGIAVLLGWAIEGEVVTTGQLIALGGILLSVALVQWPKKQHPGLAASAARIPTDPLAPTHPPE
ncbi:DMT family transporter [Phycisphaeraceae bacterium D3-23]